MTQQSEDLCPSKTLFANFNKILRNSPSSLAGRGSSLTDEQFEDIRLEIAKGFVDAFQALLLEQHAPDAIDLSASKMQ